jgi:hypothetical protein
MLAFGSLTGSTAYYNNTGVTAMYVGETLIYDTAPSTGSTLSNVTDWTTSGGVTVTGNNLTPNVMFSDTRAGSNLKVQGFSSGYVQANSTGGRIALVEFGGSTYLGTDNEMWHALFRDSGNGKLVSFSRPQIYEDFGFIQANSLIRLRTDGTTVYYEYQLPSTSNWITVKTLPQNNFNLYIGAGLYAGGLINIQQTGFS